MTAICLRQVALECTAGTSDKLYIIQVEQHGSEYRTMGYNGRRGRGLTTQEKYKGPSLAAAYTKADEVERDKRRSRSSPYTTLSTPPGVPIPGMPAGAPTPGATPASSSTPAPSAPSAPVADGPVVMLAQPVAREDIENYLTDPTWGLQRKYDGERITVSVRRSAIQAYNRDGISRPLSAVAHDRLVSLTIQSDFNGERETILDGELMGDILIVYDVLVLRDNDMRKLCYDERYAMLEGLFENETDLLAPMAFSEEEKRKMLARAEAEDWEGLIGRDLDGEYGAGRVAQLVKIKFWATCTCRVLAVNRKRSIQVGLLDETGNEVFVGNVTVPANQDVPELDGLVEVRYLYAMEGGSLYQPALLRVRSDVREADLRSSLRQAPPEKRGEADPLNHADADILAEVM